MKKIILLIVISVFTFISCQQDDDSTETIDIDLYDHLIAYFPFNGNAKNEVNPEETGRIQAPYLTTDINSNEGSAFLFNGENDVITVDHQDKYNLINDFTISVLVKPNAIKSQVILRKGPFVNGENRSPYALSFSQTGDIIFSIVTANDASINQVRKHGYEANTWYLITAVYKDNTMSLYIDGTLVNSLYIDGIVNTNNADLLIGTRLRMPSNTFSGTIDELRIYDTALSAEAISYLYNAL